MPHMDPPGPRVVKEASLSTVKRTGDSKPPISRKETQDLPSSLTSFFVVVLAASDLVSGIPR